MKNVKRTLAKGIDHVAGAAVGAAVGIGAAAIAVPALAVDGARKGAKESIKSVKKGWNDNKRERRENSKR